VVEVEWGNVLCTVPRGNVRTLYVWGKYPGPAAGGDRKAKAQLFLRRRSASGVLGRPCDFTTMFITVKQYGTKNLAVANRLRAAVRTVRRWYLE